MVIDPRIDPRFDPRLLPPLPPSDDFDLLDAPTIARLRGLKSAKKVGGVRHKGKKGKKCARESSSEDEEEQPTKRGQRGRPQGVSNYTAADITKLFSIIQKILPLGPKGWKRVHEDYDAYRCARGRPERSLKSLEGKYKGYLKMKKPTGTGTCAPEVKQAHAIESLITERAGMRELSDDIDNDSGANSSDNDIEVLDPPPSSDVHTAIARRAPTPPLRHTSRKSAPELVNKLSRAFDPEVQRARDEERFDRSAQNTQVFTLSQQLRDAHATADNLRNQISIIQQHLNDAERARDVALLKVEMMGFGGGRRAERGRHHRRGDNSRNRSPRRSRSPRRRSPAHKFRCEERYADGGACTYWITDEDDSEKENHHRSSLSRTQIHYRGRSQSAGPSRLRGQHSPSPVRPATPLMQALTHFDESSSLVTGNSVELTVTPNRVGGVPLSLIISAPHTQNDSAQ
ncbi:hypothetical protein C8J57DRAFT_1187327 [Mycena rebaudengoi]|nr:hypothetical protein C8J57DRAFT_1187327 [Mycena rebaudengoi]